MTEVLAPFEALIEKYASQFRIPPDWIRAIILTESSGNPNAKGPTGDYGLMQITVPTARALGFTGHPDELFNPEINIWLGARLLAEIQSRGITTLPELYSAYNCGNPEEYKTNPIVARNVEHFLGYCGEAN